jgi:hypothetical protein
VQDRDQHDRRRLGEVQQLRCLFEDGAGVAQVGVDVPVDARLGAVEARAGVREDDGIVVDVDDPGLWRDGLGDLVGAAPAGMPVPRSRNCRIPACADR